MIFNCMALTNSTDWPSSMPELRTIDNLLRCSICYEFLKTAMILPACSHNFCSLCIRRYLSHDNKCPSCKKPVMVPELRNNRILDELVKNFVTVRPSILKLCIENGLESPPPSNRRRANTSQISPSPGRSTRSCKPEASITSQVKILVHDFRSINKEDEMGEMKTSSSEEASPTAHKGSPAKQSVVNKHFVTKAADAFILQDDKDSDDDFTMVTPSRRNKPPTKSSLFSSLNNSNEDNIDEAVLHNEVMIIDDHEGEASTSSDSRQSPTKKAPCPVCGVSIPSKYINTHLDACLQQKERRGSIRKTPTQKPKRKPLPKLVYNLMSDKDLRKKLKEFKISHQGTRQVIVKRLQEFTLLYNAECDSVSPKPVEALVKELEKMEKVKVQQLSKKEQRVTKLQVKKGQTEEEMDKHQKDYLKAHKNQFDKLVYDARERMKKVCNTKKLTNSDNQAPASTEISGDDENSKDSVTLTQVKDSKGDIVFSNVAEAEVQPKGVGQDECLATVKTMQDNETLTKLSNNNACASLSFVTDVTQLRTESKKVDDICSKQLTNDQDSSTVPNSVTQSSSNSLGGNKVDGDGKRTVGDSERETVSNQDEQTEKMDPGTSSTESLSEKADDTDQADNSLQEPESPGSPSLLSSQAVLGDNANYSVSIHNQDNLGHSGLLGSLMSDVEPGVSVKAAADVLVPSSPSITSKADDEHIDTNELPVLEDSEVSRVQSHSPHDSVDLNCIPESPQPSTSGIRQRKRRKVETSNASESGSSVGDDSVGLRRSRRSKKSKPNV